MQLAADKKRKLKALAHNLSPVVLVGKWGLTDALIAAIERALFEHELIKLKFNAHKENKKKLAAEIIDRTGATLVSFTGNVLTLYRENPDESHRRLVL